jgi:hypothetical protein
MDIRASYRTRASPAGLNLPDQSRTRIPLIVHLHIRDRVAAPTVDLRLAVDRQIVDVITRPTRVSKRSSTSRIVRRNMRRASC